jgi:hypothetical protein
MTRRLIRSELWSLLLYCVCIAWSVDGAVAALRTGRTWAACASSLLGLVFVIVAVVEVVRFPGDRDDRRR